MYKELPRDDLMQLFAGSIIKINAKPVYISNVSEINTLIYRSISKTDTPHETIEPDDPVVDTTPVTLGFINTIYGTAFLKRIPQRQFSVGLTPNNLKFTVRIELAQSNISTAVKNIFGSNLDKTILGEYPTFSEALNTLFKKNNKLKSMAFSRFFAINKEGFVFWKDEQVGVASADSGQVVLAKPYYSLYKVLEKHAKP